MFRIISTKKLQQIKNDADERVTAAEAEVGRAMALKRIAELELEESKMAKPTMYCSFCAKSQHDVKKLIAGPSSFICDECVELCMQIIIEQNIKARAAK